uniref:PH domain-containing protein n=1 Tax=Syphacia muris TaxID=451379 RepID=A0A0N5APR4_9BILA
MKARSNGAPLDVCVVTPLERLKELALCHHLVESNERSGSFASEKSSESGAVVFTDVSEPIYKLNFKLDSGSTTNSSCTNLFSGHPELLFKESRQNQNLYNAFKEMLMSERTLTSDLRILSQKNCRSGGVGDETDQRLRVAALFSAQCLATLSILGRIIASFLEEGDSLSQNKHITSCRIAMEKIASFNTETSSTRNGLINFVKLLEIESEIYGVDNITQANRQFIREGFLLRWNSSNKMVAQIVIAFSDVLLYATLQNDNNFVVNGLIPFRDARKEGIYGLYSDRSDSQIAENELQNMMIDPKTALMINTSKNTVLFVSTSVYMHDLWKEDIQKITSTINATKPEQLIQPISVRYCEYEDQSTDSMKSFNAEKSTFKSTDTLNQTEASLIACITDILVDVAQAQAQAQR